MPRADPRVRRRIGSIAVAAALAVAAASAWADPPGHGTVELGLSRASSSSPVYRFSPEGALVRLDGRSRLAGSLLEAALSGQHEWALVDEWRPSLSARVDSRSSTQARDLEFGQLSVDAVLRHPLATGVAGVGLSLQRLWVARQAFRDAPSLHADWMRPLGDGGYVLLAYDRARYRHAGAFVDFDARVHQLSANGRIAKPWPGVSGLDFQLGWRREDNQRGLPDLSNLGRYLRLALDRDVGPWQVSAAVMVNRAHYRAGVADLLPARREQTLMVEGGASYELGEGQTLKLQAMWSRNRARPALYDNVYRSAGIGYSTVW